MSKNLTFRLNDGTQVPWLGFGTGTALFGKDASNFVKIAIEQGISLLDGAQWYNNEESLGAGIKASGKQRSDLYVVTKLKSLGEGETVESLLRESLGKLGVDYVDLFLIHSPVPFKGRLKEVWKDMEAVQKAGLTKSIGVSNFTVDHLQEILDGDGVRVVPAVNEVRNDQNFYLFEQGLIQPKK
jgi:diketogulonate reductase-like aldo/keto reductase